MMGWQAISAIAGALAVVATVVGSIILLAYNAGQHAQKLAAHHQDIEKLKATQEAHGQKLSAIDQMMKLLEEVRADVKWMRTSPARRRTPEA